MVCSLLVAVVAGCQHITEDTEITQLLACAAWGCHPFSWKAVLGGPTFLFSPVDNRLSVVFKEPESSGVMAEGRVVLLHDEGGVWTAERLFPSG